MIRPGKRGGGHSGRDTPGLFPFRTRKLRLPAPMVLHPPGCGRVGHRRLHTTKKGGPPRAPPFLSGAHTGHTATPPHRTGPHKATVPHGHARTGPHGHTHPHAHGHTGHSEHPPHPDPKNHTHGHTHKHSMSTQVDAVGYETCV